MSISLHLQCVNIDVLNDRESLIKVTRSLKTFIYNIKWLCCSFTLHMTQSEKSGIIFFCWLRKLHCQCLILYLTNDCEGTLFASATMNYCVNGILKFVIKCTSSKANARDKTLHLMSCIKYTVFLYVYSVVRGAYFFLFGMFNCLIDLSVFLHCTGQEQNRMDRAYRVYLGPGIVLLQPHSSMLHWYLGQNTITSVTSRQPWSIWVNNYRNLLRADNIIVGAPSTNMVQLNASMN